MNAYLDAMRRYTDFGSRSNQSQFWQFVIALLAIMLSAVFLDTTFQVALPNQVGLLTVIVAVLHALPLVAVSIRRMHDIGRSGWLVVMNAIPFGSVPFIALASLPSTLGANQFGETVEADAPGSSWSLDSYRQPDFTSLATAAPAPLTKASHDAVSGASGEATADIGQLERLAALRSAGVIDEAEFAQMKARLFSPAPLTTHKLTTTLEIGD